MNARELNNAEKQEIQNDVIGRAFRRSSLGIFTIKLLNKRNWQFLRSIHNEPRIKEFILNNQIDFQHWGK